MNTKLLVPAAGVLLLCSSCLALAGDWPDQVRNAPGYRAWHGGSWSTAERHWREYRQYRGWQYDRWCPPYPHGAWIPAPAWQHDPFAYHGYDRDSLTIILRGPLH